MKKIIVLSALTMILTITFSQLVLADNCDSLNGISLCVKFEYSTGGDNEYTAYFENGIFVLLGGTASSGTYSCKGENFVEVNYVWNGLEQHVWYGEAGKKGKKIEGYGKSLTNDYIYSLNGKKGECTTSSVADADSPQNQ